MKKFRIETNIIAYGPEPAPSDEVEQHLTVSETGRIWFNAYQYGDGNYLRSRSSQIYIGTEAARDILQIVLSWAEKDYRELLVTDVGFWKICFFLTAESILLIIRQSEKKKMRSRFRESATHFLYLCQFS